MRRVQLAVDTGGIDPRMIRRATFGAVFALGSTVLFAASYVLGTTGAGELVAAVCVWVGAVTGVGVVATALVMLAGAARRRRAARRAVGG
jgi:hypothetical protein